MTNKGLLLFDIVNATTFYLFNEHEGINFWLYHNPYEK